MLCIHVHVDECVKYVYGLIVMIVFIIADRWRPLHTLFERDLLRKFDLLLYLWKVHVIKHDSYKQFQFTYLLLHVLNRDRHVIDVGYTQVGV